MNKTSYTEMHTRRVGTQKKKEKSYEKYIRSDIML